MGVGNPTEIERNKQLRRIADSLEKITKILNKNVVSNVTIDQDNIKIKYGVDDKA